MTWTSSEVRYLEEHAGDGAVAIAEALGKSVTAIEAQAHRYGLSLRKRWLCPKCGRETFKPLSNRTGWCVSCTREQRAAEIAEQVRAMEEEVRREDKANKERQRLYSRKYRAKKQINENFLKVEDEETEEE
ncbi:MAG: hypothetical protein U0J86_08795 [Collinsella sp.]|nr:hypothetical protein [Collinsella sp.]